MLRLLMQELFSCMRSVATVNSIQHDVRILAIVVELERLNSPVTISFVPGMAREPDAVLLPNL